MLFSSLLFSLQTANSSNTWVICSISNKPAAQLLSPGPASPSSDRSFSPGPRSYSPGPPSVTSGGGDLNDVFILAQMDNTPPVSGGSSPIQVPVPSYRPPLIILPGPSFGIPSPNAPDSLLRRCPQINNGERMRGGDMPYPAQEVSPSNGALSNNPSFERWGGHGVEARGDYSHMDYNHSMEALQFPAPLAHTTTMDVNMDVDHFLELGPWSTG
eukprot:TRINITY_DN276_c0_g1_i1.p2 TRINITY_DN276_c0_g1~~TRINITY_DN276_c0_g1_i1.p2  ORF type:complete len:214 (+),score=20.98 TRINITY_DN276_c0_g1_i1:1213-1854(+)